MQRAVHQPQPCWLPVAAQEAAAVGWRQPLFPGLEQPCQCLPAGLPAGLRLQGLLRLLWLPLWLQQVPVRRVLFRRVPPSDFKLVRLAARELKFTIHCPKTARLATRSDPAFHDDTTVAGGWVPGKTARGTLLPASPQPCLRRRPGCAKLPRKHQAWLPAPAHRRHFRGEARA